MNALVTLLETLQWTALSVWFGGSVFVILGGAVIFEVVRRADPTLPRVLSVNLDRQHATLLASQIVEAMLRLLTRVGIASACVLLVSTIGLLVFAAPQGTVMIGIAVARVSLLATAVLLLVLDISLIRPRLLARRQEFIDHADQPDIANPALEDFQRLDRDGLRVLASTVVILLLLIVLTAIAQTPATIILNAGS